MLKSHGLFNQIFRLGANPVNRCSGHTINTVKAMHAHIRDTINRYEPPKEQSEQ